MQIDFELTERRRQIAAELKNIRPRAAKAAHLPLKAGFRFSRNAFRPSK